MTSLKVTLDTRLLFPIDEPLLGDAGSVYAGSEDAGSWDDGSGYAGSEDAGSGDAGSEDAGSGDGGLEDAGSGDGGLEDAGLEDTGSGDVGLGDSGSEDGGSGEVSLIGLAGSVSLTSAWKTSSEISFYNKFYYITTYIFEKGIQWICRISKKNLMECFCLNRKT